MKPIHFVMIIIVVFFVALVALNLAASRTTSQRNTQLAGTNPVVTGQTLYARHCAVCHGINLEGQANWQTPLPNGSYPAPPHDASGHTWHHSDEYLVSVTLYGGAAVTGTPTNAMPAYQGILSEDEVRAIFAYIKSTWPEEIRAQQAEMK